MCLTEAPLHDSRGNGLAESGIKEIKDQTRTLLAATGSAYGKTFNPDSVLIPWMLRYAGAMLNRADGRTAFERRRGWQFHRSLPVFGERVLHQIAGVTSAPARVNPRWEDSVFRQAD